MEPRPSNPTTPPMAEPVPDDAGETSHGPRTAVGKTGSDALISSTREPQIGEKVGPYPLLGELGRGGMAIVFRSKDPVLPRDIALKIMLPAATAGDPLATARFLREAGAQAKVDHPHVVAIYQAGEWNGVPFIAMPALKGQTLAARLKELREKKARLSVAELLRIGREIAEGLEAAHTVGLVHRDIKPGNVWLEEPRGWVKLLDFGLAREESAVAHEAAGAPATKMGAIVGTPSYMSPEQAKGIPVDARTDLWSLGVILYQMATGEKPFTGTTAYNLLISVIQDEPLPPDSPDLPPALIDLIQSLLAKQPVDRPRTATAVVAELTAIEKTLHAPKVIQLPIDGTDGAASAVWGALDTTEADAAPAPKTKAAREPRATPKAERERETPRTKSAQRAPAAKSLPWAWIAGGSVLAILLLGSLVWFAIQATKPKAKDETVTPKQIGPPDKKGDTKKTPPPPMPDDRKAALAFREKKATLVVQPEGELLVAVKPDDQLPAGKFVLVEVNFGTEKVHPTYAADTLLPNIAGLKSLTRIRMVQAQIELSADQVQAMAAMPLAATLERLDTFTELTPKSLAELKKFKLLRDLTCRIPVADDALLTQLGELNLQFLTIVDLRQSEGVTEKGWRSLAKLPLSKLFFFDSQINATAFRALTAKGGQRSLWLVGGTLDDEALLELSRQPSDVMELVLWGLKEITDETVLHLAKVPTLKKLDVTKTSVTDAGVRNLLQLRPTDLKVNRLPGAADPRG